MSKPNMQPDFRSLWEGYKLESQDTQAARSRELAEKRMRLSMAGMTPQSDNWKKSMADIESKYASAAMDTKKNATYDQLRSNFTRHVAGETGWGKFDLLNQKKQEGDRGYWNQQQQEKHKTKFMTELGLLRPTQTATAAQVAERRAAAEQAIQKSKGHDTSKMKEFMEWQKAGAVLDAPSAEEHAEAEQKLSVLMSVGAGKDEVRGPGMAPRKVTAEDQQLFDQTMERFYNSRYGDVKPVEKTKQEKAMDEAKKAAATGGRGGKKRTVGGGGKSKGSPNVEGVSLFNPLSSDEEKDKQANPWV